MIVTKLYDELDLTLEEKLNSLDHTTINDKQLVSDYNDMKFDVFYKIENDDEDYIDTGFVSIEGKNKIHISIDGSLELKIKDYIDMRKKGDA